MENNNPWQVWFFNFFQQQIKWVEGGLDYSFEILKANKTEWKKDIRTNPLK